MNIEQPPVPAQNFDRPPNDLDRLLAAFLRAEVPEPWPVLKAPAHPAPAPLPATSRRWPRLNSRFALAATVALCLVGSFMLMHLFPVAAGPGANNPSGEMIGPRVGAPSREDGWKQFKEKTSSGHVVQGWEKGSLEKGFIIRLESIPEEEN